MNLTIGATVIPYQVRESTQARTMKIVVTPAAVEVVVPVGTSLEGPGGVHAYLQRKRRWVFDAVREMKEKHRALLQQHYTSGAKMQYRGRWLMLDVQGGDVTRVEINCRSKFQVVVPRGWEGDQRVEGIRVAFDRWLHLRAEEMVEQLRRRHESTLGVMARGYHLSQAKARWGWCGQDGTIHIHWRLIQAPTAALEYVVAHEITHLVHRNHSPLFWTTLGKTLPDWAQRKAMLERWEAEPRAV